MRIVIDLQAAQSPSTRVRGIGRYSVALAKAMLRQRGDHEVWIALNGMYADTIAPIRNAFSGLVPMDRIRVWHATVPPMDLRGMAPAQRQAAELVREAFMASLDPDVVHIASMFESGPFSVSSTHRRSARALTAVTLYDLIPHIYPDVYLATPQAQRQYAEQLQHLRGADLWLAISESSRQEGIERLGLPAELVTTISSGADEHFTAAPVPRERETSLRERHGLTRPFAMYTGGIDHRKNIEGLIRAWAGLPAHLRQAHQLGIVCAVQPADRARLESLMADSGLAANEVLLTGFVPEEDLVDLYRLCKLFVFPSLHEGFGLPALEAMRCGAAVIGSDNSSIPEVIGRTDALFDARSTDSITAKIRECLQDEQLRGSLARHGQQQAERFSWDNSARLALAAFESAVARHRPAPAAAKARPKLAFVSPMPPQRSAIADYSAELLPPLAAYYDIDLILSQETLAAPEATAVCGQRSAEWFMEHGAEYDRVLYHFGNSTYHTHMFPLLERHPGTVVLHDFYVSGLLSHLEWHGGGLEWSHALYESHGWAALADRFHAAPLSDAVNAWPANFSIVRQATGVIVHSAHALQLARQWYGPELTSDWTLIPLLRTPAPLADRAAARERLGLGQDEFIACSFGMLGPTKCNHRLLAAWRSSDLWRAAGARLLFVGEQQASPYCVDLQNDLAKNPGNVQVTGWVDPQTYRDYLAAADIAVQLRAHSRGETSAAVLDCMNHGLATIANREGSMADLDPQALWLIPQEFSDAELGSAMETLWRDAARRAALAQRARELVRASHRPDVCAQAYARAIEGFARAGRDRTQPLVGEIGEILRGGAPLEPVLSGLAQAIAMNLPEKRPARQVLVDVTQLAQKPGTETLPALLRRMVGDRLAGWRVEPVYQCAPGDWRYARKYMLAQLGCPQHVLGDDPIDVQPGDIWCVMPPEDGTAAERPLQVPQRVSELGLAPEGVVHAALAWAALTSTSEGARRTRWFIDISELVQRDSQSGIQRVVKNYLLELLLRPPAGVRVVPVYATTTEAGYRIAAQHVLKLAGLPGADLPDPPIEASAGDLFFGLDLQPHVVPAQAAFLGGLRDQGVRVGFMVYDLLPVRLPHCFGPGAAENHGRWLEVVANADLAVCISRAVADDLGQWLRENPQARRQTAPLQIESVHLGGDLTHSLPTRGIPEGGEQLLQELRRRPSFLMVGTVEPRKAHAQVLAAFERLWAGGADVALVISGRPGWMVDSLVASLRSHPERDRRLFWLDSVSDEFLERVYGACACLIAASFGEGFGLPLVEAAQHGLPIIARDLPVFREVAGSNASYFQDDQPAAFAAFIKRWLAAYREGRHPASSGMRWLTWRESAGQLEQVLLETARPQPM